MIEQELQEAQALQQALQQKLQTPEKLEPYEKLNIKAKIKRLEALTEKLQILAQFPQKLIFPQGISFFIGLTKADRHEHTSVIAGVFENDMPTLLLRVGKNEFTKYCRKLIVTFGSVEFELDIPLRGARSYVAYHITIEQYNQLIHLLRLANIISEEPIYCYQQITSSKNSSQPLQFTLSKIATSPYPANAVEEVIQVTMGRFCMQKNNCRHMGIAVVKNILNAKTLPGQVSSNYLDNLFFQDTFVQGNPTSGFLYVFPLPPRDNDIQKIPTLVKLYQYLVEPNQNKAKLFAISALYNFIQSSLASGSMEEYEMLGAYLRGWLNKYGELFPKKSPPKNYFDFFSSFIFLTQPTVYDMVNDISNELNHRFNTSLTCS